MNVHRKRFALAAWGVLVLFGLGTGLYDFASKRAAERAATDWQQRAAQAAGREVTLDSAKAWLEANGFRVAIWNPHVARGFIAYQKSTGEPIHLIVMGERAIRSEGVLLEGIWLRLSFRFSEQGEFRDVRTDLSAFQFPTTRPA
jgi:hypothetical protein